MRPLAAAGTVVAALALAAGVSACGDAGPSAGRVVDAVTGIGVPQIEVSCLDDGALTGQLRTGPSGEFDFGEASSCASLRARDVDGPANGSYREAAVDGGADVIRLAPL